MKGSDLFVKCLEEEGVRYVFALPGEENIDLLESLRASKIKVIINRHEQASAFMAATYGRLTGATNTNDTVKTFLFIQSPLFFLQKNIHIVHSIQY